jgi:hypothetical protein
MSCTNGSGTLKGTTKSATLFVGSLEAFRSGIRARIVSRKWLTGASSDA